MNVGNTIEQRVKLGKLNVWEVLKYIVIIKHHGYIV